MNISKLLSSFNYAIDGIVYVLKTQRNMKIHVLVAIIVILLGLFLNVSKLELLVLIATIALVIITEMINTSIESTINLITSEYHELAKIAKNVAAGAVLIAAINAAVVGYIIFFHRIITIIKMLGN